MYIVYKFFPVYIEPFFGNEMDNVWVAVSRHSQLDDALIQLQRFITVDTPSNYVQILSEQEPVPTAPPL